MLTLNNIRRNKYPTILTPECVTGLCLFGAGFYGANDSIHMYDNKMLDVTVVDVDGDKLSLMQSAYPDKWTFIHNDVFAWLDRHEGRRTWDIVSVDPPRALFDKCLEQIDKFRALSSKHLVYTCSSEQLAYLLENYPVSEVVERSRAGKTWLAAIGSTQ